MMDFETFTWTWLLCAGFLFLVGLAYLVLHFLALRALRRLDRTAARPCHLHLHHRDNKS